VPCRSQCLAEYPPAKLLGLGCLAVWQTWNTSPFTQGYCCRPYTHTACCWFKYTNRHWRSTLWSVEHPQYSRKLTFHTPPPDLLPHHQPLAAAACSARCHAVTVQAGLQVASLTLLCSSCLRKPAVLRLRWRRQHATLIRFACANQRQLLHGWSLDVLLMLLQLQLCWCWH